MSSQMSPGRPDCSVDEWKREVKKEWMTNCRNSCCFRPPTESVWTASSSDLRSALHTWNTALHPPVRTPPRSPAPVLPGCGRYSCWCSPKSKRSVVYPDLSLVWSEFSPSPTSSIFPEVLHSLYYLFDRLSVYETSWNSDSLRLASLNGLKQSNYLFHCLLCFFSNDESFSDTCIFLCF